MASGEFGYTKAREIVSMATPETQDSWLKAAKGTRKELISEVKKAKRAAKVDPSQGELLPSSQPVGAPRELPVRFQVDLTPEQETRRSVLVESREMEIAGEAKIKPHKAVQSGTPRGDFSSQPPVQVHVHVHVHEDANIGRMTVQTDAGERELSKAESERMHCDAAICEHGGRNTTTIPHACAEKYSQETSTDARPPVVS